MARLNRHAPNTNVTHEGARASRISAEQQLRRSVLSCLLWENAFYEDGEEIASRITRLADKVSLKTLYNLALEAREDFNLRHVPLLLAVAATKHSGKSEVGELIAEVIQRPDEITEFLAIYWKDGKRPLSAQAKKGLARAFGKFDEYQLAKYDRNGPIKLRDAMRLVHPKPASYQRNALYHRVIERNLQTPDTWEVRLSAGKDKKESFEELLAEGKLGYMALLRNLRNMEESGVDRELIKHRILERKGASRVLPFRYVAAARAAPSLEPWLDQALVASVKETRPMPGRTIVLVDVSGSMEWNVSKQSQMSYMDAAATLASVINGDRRVFTFSNDLREVAPRLGMAGVDAIINSQNHGGTYLGRAVTEMNGLNVKGDYDRLIVITDEQSRDRVPAPHFKNAYMINVASYQNGVSYGAWTHLDGWSEGVIRFIHEVERNAR